MQDEIVRAITGIRNIPPHHAEATAASEAYRSAFCWPSTKSCQFDHYLTFCLHSPGSRPSRILAGGWNVPCYIVCACRLDELMPAGVRESLDVSRLERAAEDLEYRDSVLRAEDGVCG